MNAPPPHEKTAPAPVDAAGLVALQDLLKQARSSLLNTDHKISAIAILDRVIQSPALAAAAEREVALVRERDNWFRQAQTEAVAARAAEARATAAEAERDKMREALEPFAKAMDAAEADCIDQGADPSCLTDDFEVEPISPLGTTPKLCTYGDLRRARAAIRKETTE